MNRYVCPVCGRFSYSSVPLEAQADDSCPYPFCEGHVIPAPEDQKCRVCGCTWDHACPGGCYWVEPALCSRCAGEAVSNVRSVQEHER